MQGRVTGAAGPLHPCIPCIELYYQEPTIHSIQSRHFHRVPKRLAWLISTVGPPIKISGYRLPVPFYHVSRYGISYVTRRYTKLLIRLRTPTPLVTV